MWTMRVSAVLLVLFIQNVTGNSPGTTFLSCESCHDQSKCLESPVKPERGNTFFSQSVSCVCKDGFVGDGLTCYDVKLCTNSSCCHQGYRWSPEKGCVDIDECSLPEAPCTHGSQVCVNTPGSFECLVTPSRAKRSVVRFSCGNVVCPLGQDCINSRCVDPCDHHKVLNDAWRATTYKVNGDHHCDKRVNWQGWYRLFLGKSSAQMSETCVQKYMCGTNVPLWMKQSHPAVSDGIVQRSVCGTWQSGCCQFNEVNTAPPIHVKNCNRNYYVYKFVKPKICDFAYCADLSSKYPQAPPVTVTQPPPVPVTQPPPVTVTQPPPASASELICGQSQIQIGLLLTGLQSSGLNGSSGHLANPRCSSFTERDGTVWYQVERQADTCGNILTTNNTHAIYSNSLFIYSANNISLPERFPFSCVYPLDTETSLDVAIKPNLQLEGGTSGVGSPTNTSMSLFQKSNYTEPYPAGPVTLPVGSALYVGVSVGETDPRFAVVLDDCYATHSSSPDDLMRHFLIQNKCSINRRQVTVVESGSSLQARFSALLFLFHGDYRDIYLHCSLHLCDQRASSCSPVCSGRRRRSVSTSVPFKSITIGPITWDKLVE